MTKVKQVKLQQQIETGRREMVTWLDKVKELKVGRFVTLKEDPDGGRWEIVWVGNSVKNSDALYSRHGQPVFGSIVGDSEYQ